jgi:hypothetical protein
LDDVRIVSRLESADGSMTYAFSNELGRCFEAISFAYDSSAAPLYEESRSVSTPAAA